MKRLAKLQQIASTSSTSQSSASPATPPPATPKPKPIPRPSVSAAPQATAPSPRPALGLARKKTTVAKLDLAAWEHESIGSILQVTLEVYFVPYVHENNINTDTPVRLATSG